MQPSRRLMHFKEKPALKLDKHGFKKEILALKELPLDQDLLFG